jgi:hypothetical protein
MDRPGSASARRVRVPWRAGAADRGSWNRAVLGAQRLDAARHGAWLRRPGQAASACAGSEHKDATLCGMTFTSRNTNSHVLARRDRQPQGGPPVSERGLSALSRTGPDRHALVIHGGNEYALAAGLADADIAASNPQTWPSGRAYGITLTMNPAGLEHKDATCGTAVNRLLAVAGSARTLRGSACGCRVSDPAGSLCQEPEGGTR